MNYRQEMSKISGIVNKHIAEFTKVDSSIITSDIDFTKAGQLLSLNNLDIFFKVFNIKVPSLKNSTKSFFHYKRFDRAYEFVEKDFIRLSALSNFRNVNNGDDIKEYEHFFDVAKIGTNQSFVDQQKDNYFIFCLTEDNCTERFWKEYADDKKGLCLELEIIDKQSPMFDLNKICYDDGLEFQFFADMQNEIHSTFGKYLLTQGLSKFAAFYKRKTKEDGSEGFAWERETRLLVNWGMYANQLKDFSFENYNGYKSLQIPFDNSLFSINLKSVTLGENLTPDQKQKIENLLKQKNITIK